LTARENLRFFGRSQVALQPGLSFRFWGATGPGHGPWSKAPVRPSGGMAGAPVTGALVFLAIPNKEVHAAILEAADSLDGRVVVDISSNTVDVGTFDGLTMD